MKNWEKFKLGDLCEVITKGTTPTSIGHRFTESGINFIKVESLDESGEIIPNKVAYIDENCHKSLSRSQLKKDDILFSIAGALGRIGVVKSVILPANTNQALAIIRLRKDSNALVEFIAKFFKSSFITDEIEKLRIGAAQQNLSLTQLNNLIVHLPPLPEQQRIVAILDECFSVIERSRNNAEKNLQNARELFESYLESLMFDDGELGIEKLENVAEVEYGFTDKAISNGDYRYIRITDIDNEGLLSDKEKVYIKGTTDAKKYVLQHNDLLMARTGATFAKVLLYEEREPSVFASYLIRIKFKREITPKFYWYFSKSAYYWAQAKQFSSGAAQPQFNGNALKKLIIPIPSLKKQQAIVRQLDVLRLETQKLESVYQKRLEDLEELKKSILQKAFSGELSGGELDELKTEKVKMQ